MGQVFIQATVPRLKFVYEGDWWNSEIPPIEKSEQRWLIWLKVWPPSTRHLYEALGWFSMTFHNPPTSIHTSLREGRNVFHGIPVFGHFIDERPSLHAGFW